MGGRRKKSSQQKGIHTIALSSYIYKVLKQVHPDTGLSKRAMEVMNDYCCHAFGEILREAVLLTEKSGKATMTSREVQTGVRLCLPGELAKHAVSEGTKAVTKYNSNPGGSKSVRAGLQFPVGRIHTAMKTKSRLRVGQGAPVYMAAVLEYLAAEVLELSGNAARDNRKCRIIPRHIMLAIRNDEELNKFCKNVDIHDAGVIPNIHSVLLPSKPNKSSSFSNSQPFGNPQKSPFGQPTGFGASGFGNGTGSGFGQGASVFGGTGGGFGAQKFSQQY